MTVVTIDQVFPAFAAPGAGPGDRAARVAEMFGLGLDERREVPVCRGLRLDVRPGDVVFITGPSGSGKSVILARLAEDLRAAWPGARCVDLGRIRPPAGRTVIDGLPGELEASLHLASMAGLADAFALLRRPPELSAGQRWRLRLAHALRRLVDDPDSDGPSPEPARVLVADELGSTLDRRCALAVACRIRRAADRWGLTVLAASAHDDLVADLAPDVLVVKECGDRAAVHYADPARYEEDMP